MTGGNSVSLDWLNEQVDKATKDSEKMNDLKIEVGKFYRAKKPSRCIDGGYNDRHVLWINEDKTKVQYDSPTIGQGRHYPTVPIEKFLKWAGKEITKEEYLEAKR